MLRYSSNTQPATILVIEDDPIARRILVSNLSKMGHGTLEAESWAQAEPLLEEQIDLILLDLNLPDATGLDIMVRIEMFDHLVDVPVVVITASHDDSDILNMFQAGIVDYLFKPVHPVILNAKVNLLLDWRARSIEMEHLATRDPLTNLYNRRHFRQQFDIEWYRAMREERPLSLLVIDLDKFKQINDTHGHQNGDDVLVNVADAIERHARRSSDIPARYGGDEFVLLLPSLDKEGAVAIGNLIYNDIRQDKTVLSDNDRSAIDISVTIGCASHVPTEEDEPDMLFAEADELLLEAKRNNQRGGVKVR